MVTHILNKVDKEVFVMRFSVKTMVLAAMFAVLTAVGAYIRIPTPVVPFTLQTMFVLLAGVLLGARVGALSQVLYVVIGFLGLPVFAGGVGGVQVVFSPTFGFLLGFIGGAFMSGFVLERLKAFTFKNVLLACIAGTAAIYLFGLMGLYLNLNFVAGKTVSLWKVLKIGFFPFVITDSLKALGVAALGAKIAPRLKNLM
ncbi:biotin transporter BioY [Thermovirga sp.]|uniref:biotin transporter BioY n=1 Tax=Thermovirga sp. TaxID=2699834 RepID=UPI0025E80015|nr:biotin transporter BioY [Thermovirga sp.]